MLSYTPVGASAPQTLEAGSASLRDLPADAARCAVSPEAETEPAYDAADAAIRALYRMDEKTALTGLPADGTVLAKLRKAGKAVLVEGERVSAAKLSTDTLRVRWTRLTRGGEGWTAEGELRWKKGTVTVKKTLAGDERAVNEVRQGEYALLAESSRRGLYTLTLADADRVDEQTGTYTWFLKDTRADEIWHLSETGTDAAPLRQVQPDPTPAPVFTPDPAEPQTPSPEPTTETEPSADPALSATPEPAAEPQLSATPAPSAEPEPTASPESSSDLEPLAEPEPSPEAPVSGGSGEVVFFHADTVKVLGDGQTDGKSATLTGFDGEARFASAYAAKGDALVRFTDASTGTFLPGVKVRVTENGEKAVFAASDGAYARTEGKGVTVLTAEDGVLVLHGVQPGDGVTLQFVKVPDGYIWPTETALDAKRLQVRIAAAAEDLRLCVAWGDNVQKKPEVTARLTANGGSPDRLLNGFGEPAVLKKSNGWTVTWKGLPAVADGQKIVWSAEETKLGEETAAACGGFASCLTHWEKETEEKGIRVLRVRHCARENTVTVRAADAVGRSQPGAAFTLKCTKNEDPVTAFTSARGTTDEDGLLTFRGLPHGTYTLTQTGAADGKVPADPAVLTVAEDGTLSAAGAEIRKGKVVMVNTDEPTHTLILRFADPKTGKPAEKVVTELLPLTDADGTRLPEFGSLNDAAALARTVRTEDLLTAVAASDEVGAVTYTGLSPAALLVLPGREQAWTFEPFVVTWNGEKPDSTRTLSPVLTAADSTPLNILPVPTAAPETRTARPGQRERRGVPSASGSTLPQTGRNAWAVPVLAGAGLLLVVTGGLLLTVGKRHE